MILNWEKSGAALGAPWLRNVSKTYGYAILPVTFFVLFMGPYLTDDPNPGITGKILIESVFLMPIFLIVGYIGGMRFAYGPQTTIRVLLGKLFCILPLLDFIVFSLITFMGIIIWKG